MSDEIGQVYVGVWDENDQEIWHATNKPVQADFLVALDLAFGDVDLQIEERYESVLKALLKNATTRQDLSQFNWLITANLSLPDMFNIVLMELGLEHHNYTVVELATGQGFSYNAKRRVVYEISSTET